MPYAYEFSHARRMKSYGAIISEIPRGSACLLRAETADILRFIDFCVQVKISRETLKNRTVAGVKQRGKYRKSSVGSDKLNVMCGFEIASTKWRLSPSFLQISEMAEWTVTKFAADVASILNCEDRQKPENSYFFVCTNGAIMRIFSNY